MPPEVPAPAGQAKAGIASNGICGFCPPGPDFMPDPDSDPIPRLRVVDDEEAGSPRDVVRLRAGGGSGPTASTPAVKVAPMPAPAEPAERLEGEGREHYEGRSIEPNIDAILEPQEVAASVEQAWGEGESRVGGLPYGWAVLVVLLVLGGGIWSFRNMRQGEAKVAQEHEVVREKAQIEEQEDATARKLVEAVESTLTQYLAADTLEKILPVVRDPSRVKPLIAETWKTKPPVPVKYRRMIVFRPDSFEGKLFWVVRAEVDGGPPQSLLLEQTSDTEVKVDWETHACYQPMPWDRYIKERPTGQALEFRVNMVRDVFYSHEFSDSTKWRCFRLTTRDSDEHVFGYAQVGSEAAQMLEALCDAFPGTEVAAILSLRVPEQSSTPRGVVIEKMVEPRWLRISRDAGNSP